MAQGKRRQKNQQRNIHYHTKMTFERYNSLSDEEKEDVLLRKITEVIKSHLTEHYPEKEREQEWLRLITIMPDLGEKIGIIIEDEYEVNSVVLKRSEVTLYWFNIGTFHIPAEVFRRSAAKLWVQG